MSRMKTFITYLILFLLFYVFTSVISYVLVRSTIKDLPEGEIAFQNPAISISEAKASKVHATIKGKIKSEENQDIQFKYIRIDMISKLGNVVSTKYIDVSDIANGGEKEFSIKTNSENVEKYKMSLTDINETNETETKFHEISEVLIGALLVWLIIS